MSRNPYVRPLSRTRWYFKQPRYLRYMSREVTCVFVGAFALLLLCAVERLSEGHAAWQSFLAAITGPWSVLALVVVLAFCLHNTTSWFNVTPKVMPVQIGESFLPGKFIVAAHYVAWLAVSLAVLYFAGVL